MKVNLLSRPDNVFKVDGSVRSIRHYSNLDDRVAEDIAMATWTKKDFDAAGAQSILWVQH